MGKFQTDDDILDLAAAAADKSLREPWHGLAPDEWAMAAEEGLAEEGWSLAGATGTLLAFLFADGAEDWRKVGRRASALLRRYSVARAAKIDLSEFQYFTGWGMEEFVALVGEENKGLIGRILAWFYPFDGVDGLRRGTERLYLFALVFEPQLLRYEKDGHKAGEPWPVMGYVKLEMAFGGMPPDLEGEAKELEENRARSKWSARGCKVRAEFEKAGWARTKHGADGSCEVEFVKASGSFEHASFFGKSEAARKKYRAAAMGNRNRLGGGKRGNTDETD